jgi:hypothetical protein
MFGVHLTCINEYERVDSTVRSSFSLGLYVDNEVLALLYIFTEKGISFALKGQYKVRMSKMYAKPKMHA